MWAWIPWPVVRVELSILCADINAKTMVLLYTAVEKKTVPVILNEEKARDGSGVGIRKMTLCTLCLKPQQYFCHILINMSDFNSLKASWKLMRSHLMVHLTPGTSSAPSNHPVCSGQGTPGSTAQWKTDHSLLAGQSLRNTSFLRQAAPSLRASGSITREEQHWPEQPEVPGTALFPAIVVKLPPYVGTAIPVHQKLGWDTILFHSQLISEGRLWLTEWNTWKKLDLPIHQAIQPVH